MIENSQFNLKMNQHLYKIVIGRNYVIVNVDDHYF